MADEDIFYSTKAAAEFLGVSERTIQRYRKEGILTPDGFGKNNSVLYGKKNLIQVMTRLLSSGDTFLKNQPQVVTRYQKILEEDAQVVTRSSEVVKRSEEQESEVVITVDSTVQNSSNNTSRQNFSEVTSSVEIDYRTIHNSGADDLSYPENLALPTIPRYQFAMSMLQKGEAYLQSGVNTDFLKFRNGKLFFEDSTGVLQRVSEVELKNFQTRESITKINGLPTLRAFYTIFLTNYHDSIVKREPLPKYIKVYMPDFANYLGLKRNSDKKTIDGIISQMNSFHNVIGVMENSRNGRDGKSYYPVLNFEGYDDKTNTIEVSSPYLFHVIETIYRATLVIDKRSKQPKLKKNGEPLRLPSHSYVVKSSIRVC